MAAPAQAADARLRRAGESSLQALAQRAQEGGWEWRQSGGQRGPASAPWLQALRHATRTLANRTPEPADAADELTLWSGERLLARLLLRGSELWICEPAAVSCELRAGQAAELQTLWRPAARAAR